MSRWKVLSMVLIIGLGIGGIVPAATYWWDNNNRADSVLNTLNPETVLASDALTKEESYHFRVEHGVLSVIEGKLGESGKIVVTGLSVESWPQKVLEMALEVEFYSLDEVQSFIDTVNEFPWLLETD